MKRVTCNGSIYVLECDNGDDITVSFNGKNIGEFEFVYEEASKFHSGYYRLSQSHITDTHKRKGIGREILKFHKELFDEEIRASGHLVDDGIGFVEAMQNEGLISQGDPI